MQLTISLFIFIITFYLIITEKVPNSIATMLGGLFMVLIKIIDEEHALDAVGHRLKIIFLLIGMMIIVHFISETGIFQYIAIWAAKFTKGNAFLLLALLSIITAFCSAFLDNVTTLLLMAPIAMLLASQLQVSPYIFIMTLVLSANIGGLATLIGDPTQLIIGSEGHISFNAFLFNTAPIAILSLGILLLTVYIIYHRDMKVSRDLKAKIMSLDPSRSLTNVKLFQESATILLLVILGFVMDNFLDIGLSIIALLGAMILILLAKHNPVEVFKHVEWDTLFFFIGLFILTEGLEGVGLDDVIGNFIDNISHGNLAIATTLILWISAGLTSIIGNVANAAMVSKIIHHILPIFHFTGVNPLWWALSFGSLLGGNLTPLASATNIVAISSANKGGA